MAIVRPFKGIHYSPENVLLKHVLAPPYDVISPEYRETLSLRSQYNVVNIDLPIGEDKYLNASHTYNEWLDKNILIQDREPVIYLYEQEYEFGGKVFARTGFISLLKLEPLGEGSVYPHEKTLSGPKLDRLELMTASKANFSSVFGLYMDKEDKLKGIFGKIRQGMPMLSAIDDAKVKHSIWPITDKDAVREIQLFMKDRAVYIADGHHRYETSLTYRENMRKKNADQEGELKPYDFVMMTFVNAFDPGLVILPTHRVIDTPPFFDELVFEEQLKGVGLVTKLDSAAGAESYLKENPEALGKMVILTSKKEYGITLNPDLLEPINPAYRNVDAHLLQKIILEGLFKISEERILAKEGIYFYHTKEEAEEHLKKSGGVAFILNSVSMETIQKISENGLVMPQKSTFFFPKLASGLIFNSLD